MGWYIKFRADKHRFAAYQIRGTMTKVREGSKEFRASHLEPEIANRLMDFLDEHHRLPGTKEIPGYDGFTPADTEEIEIEEYQVGGQYLDTYFEPIFIRHFGIRRK